MSALIEWMKDYYIKAKNNELEWKDMYYNNDPSNTRLGVYTDVLFFPRSDQQLYIKFTIEKCYSTAGCCVDDPSTYYLLYKLEKMLEKQETSDCFDPLSNGNEDIAKDCGSFFLNLDSEDEAKIRACDELKQILSSHYSFFMNDDEDKEWQSFLEDNQ